MSADDRQNRVRERAYRIWQAEGGEHGRSDEYWARAEAIEAAEADTPPVKPGPEDAAPVTLPKAKPSKAASKPAAPQPNATPSPVAAKPSRRKTPSKS